MCALLLDSRESEMRVSQLGDYVASHCTYIAHHTVCSKESEEYGEGVR